MKRVFLSIALLLSSFTATLQAAIQRVDHSKSVVCAQRHEVIDIAFKASGSINSPFETEFYATFTSPSNEQQQIPAFYNGDREWVVRFTASEAGEWSYVTSSELKSLNNKSGKVTITDQSYANRRGAVKANPEDPRHLIWGDGTPYFLLGFECDFLFTLDYHNDQTPNLESFLDKLEGYNFNHLVMNLYANDVVWEKDPDLKAKYEFGGDDTIFPFMGSNSEPDHSTLNVEFFKRFDRTMEAMNDRNLVSHLMIYVWNKAVNWPEVGSADDDRYFDYVVKRYQAFSNIVWDISKEALYYGVVDDNYISERIERLRELDSYDRMVTVHDIGYCNRNMELVDMASNQNWKLSLNADMSGNYKQYESKPVLNVEHGGYEQSDYEVFCGNYINAEECLRRNYECLFAGTYTTYYWQGCSWNVLIYDWATNPEVVYKPKMHYFKHMGDFFTKYPFHNFRPEPKLNNSGYCLGNEAEDTYLIYLPCESYKTAIGSIMGRSRKMSFQWFNTITGEYTDVVECTQMDIFANQPHPWHMEDDAILIVKILETK